MRNWIVPIFVAAGVACYFLLSLLFQIAQTRWNLVYEIHILCMEGSRAVHAYCASSNGPAIKP